MPDLGQQLDRSRLPTRTAYLAVLLLATLSSFRLDPEPTAVLQRARWMMDPTVSPRDLVDGARNFLLFAGWGLVWILSAPPGKSWMALRGAALSGFVVSLTLEGLQLFSATRTASVLDVATNTTGSIFGAVAFTVAVMQTSRRRTARSYLGVPAVVLAASYGAAILGEAVTPLLRQQPLPDVFGGPGGRLRASLGMFEWSSLAAIPWGDVLLFAPVGVLAVAAMAEAGLPYGRSALLVGIIGTGVSVAAEIGHGLLGIRIQAGAALTHALAMTVGAAATARWLPALTRKLRGRARAGVALSLYGILLTLWALRPYLPETSGEAIADKLTAPWWVPLGLLAQRADVYSVVDVAVGFLLYLPLGALLGVWPLARSGWLRWVWPAVLLALTTEALQTVVLARWPTVTDVLVQAAGAMIGWVIVRRAGFRPHGTVL